MSFLPPNGQNVVTTSLFSKCILYLSIYSCYHVSKRLEKIKYSQPNAHYHIIIYNLGVARKGDIKFNSAAANHLKNHRKSMR